MVRTELGLPHSFFRPVFLASEAASYITRAIIPLTDGRPMP